MGESPTPTGFGLRLGKSGIICRLIAYAKFHYGLTLLMEDLGPREDIPFDNFETDYLITTPPPFYAEENYPGDLIFKDLGTGGIEKFVDFMLNGTFFA